MKILKTASGKKILKISRREWWDIGRKQQWLKCAFKDFIELGPTPPEEESAQVGEDDYRKKAIAECRRYIGLIRQKLGSEPEGARLKIKSYPHDFGTYYEVACEYDDSKPVSVDYAFACESQGPQTWNDTTPVQIERSETEDLSESPEDYEKNFISKF